jgi:hypothetical protein
MAKIQKTLTSPTAGRIQKSRSPHSLPSTATVKDIAVLKKTKHSLTTWFSSHTTRYLLKQVENLRLHKTCIEMFILTLFIIVKNSKQPWRPLIGERINKPWAMQTMEYYLTIKREMSYQDMEKAKMHIIKWKKLIQEGNVLYESIYMTFWKRQN